MEKKKLRSFSLKQIRALEQRKKKLQVKLFKENLNLNSNEYFHPISPLKYIDPFKYHRIISDFIVIEQPDNLEDEYFSPIKQLIQLKHIAQIDFFEDFVYAKFENATNYPYSSLDLVVSRLRSIGKQNAYNLAQDILEYKEICLLIKTVKQYGYQKELLSSFSQKHLMFLKDYFQAMSATSLTSEKMKSLVKEVFDKNKKNPVFFLIYDEYKEEIGTHLKGVGMNKAMRQLVGWKEMEICYKKIWSFKTKEYHNYLSKLFKEFVINHGFFQELFINTIFGYYKMVFEVKTYFIVGDAKKIIFSLCVAKEMTSVLELPLSILEAFYENEEKKEMMEKKFEVDECAKSDMWNKLIDYYFKFDKEV